MKSTLDLVKDLTLNPTLGKKQKRVESRTERRKAERDRIKSTKLNQK